MLNLAPTWLSLVTNTLLITALNPHIAVKANHLSSLTLFSLSLGHYVLMYWANIYLARHLTIDEFDDFNVAISIVTLLSTLATLGLEKYALRIASLYIERENWPRLRGFWLFSLGTIFLFSVILIGVLGLGLEAILAWHETQFHIAIVIYAGFLPIIAICLFLLEMIAVFGQQILAVSLYRFVLPAVFVVLIMELKNIGLSFSATTAVMCLGAAWGFTLLLMSMTAYAISPRNFRLNKPDMRGRTEWLRHAIPLLMSSLMMTSLTSTGTIILEIIHPSEAVVAMFAIAMQTSGLISLIGTSTNRYYLPMLVVLIERHDYEGIKHLLNKRMRMIACFVALYFCILLLWGSDILALFGTDFSEGFHALLISACGATFSTLFAESPYYLQFMGRNKLVVSSMTIAAGIMVILGFFLGWHYGATGVAVAYALPTLSLFSYFKWYAGRHLRHSFQHQCSS